MSLHIASKLAIDWTFYDSMMPDLFQQAHLCCYHYIQYLNLIAFISLCWGIAAHQACSLKGDWSNKMFGVIMQIQLCCDCVIIVATWKQKKSYTTVSNWQTHISLCKCEHMHSHKRWRISRFRHENCNWWVLYINTIR